MFRDLIRWTLVSLCVLAMLAIVPNVYWLRGSSVQVRNLGPDPVPVRVALADDPDQLVELGEIAAGSRSTSSTAPSGAGIAANTSNRQATGSRSSSARPAR